MGDDVINEENRRRETDAPPFILTLERVLFFFSTEREAIFKIRVVHPK